MDGSLGTTPTPIITMGLDGRVKHTGNPCKVILTEHMITVGCLTISPEAARHIMRKYDENFRKPASVVLD